MCVAFDMMHCVERVDISFYCIGQLRLCSDMIYLCYSML